MQKLYYALLVFILGLGSAALAAAGRDVSLVNLTVEATIPAEQTPSIGERFNVLLSIRNGDAGLRPAPPAIALRAVFWADDGEDDEIWRGPLAGVDAENDDGTIDFVSASGIAHTADTIPMTTRSFEHGLLLVNEELQLSRPTRLTRAITRELVVRYVIIPRREYQSLFVPIESPGDFRTVFGPMTDEAWQQRQGRGSLGLLQAAENAQSDSLNVIEERIDIRLSFEDGAPGETQ